MSINKKLRFSVFKRDNFTCQYCGKTPPDVVLEADHVICVKDGGKDDKMNLITACFACNRGKGGSSVCINSLSKQALKKELKLLKEEKEQLAAYYNFTKQKEEHETNKLKVFADAWKNGSSHESELSKKGNESIKKLLKTHSAQNILKAIDITWKKIWKSGGDEPFRYMCGVLKNLKLEEDNPEEHLKKKRIYKLRYQLKNRIYINEGRFWKWMNDDEDDILPDLEKKAESFKNLTTLTQSLNTKYYGEN